MVIIKNNSECIINYIKINNYVTINNLKKSIDYITTFYYSANTELDYLKFDFIDISHEYVINLLFL